MKNLNLRTVITAAGILIGYHGFAQTGAAGVGTSATQIIWLDAHDMGFTDGSNVSNAPDVSGNGNDFTQATSSLQPVYTDGLINGLPAIQYDGTDDILNGGAIAALDAANITYFVVFQRATLDDQMLVSAGYTSNNPKWRTYCNPGNNNLIGAHYSPSIQYCLFSDPGANNFMSVHMTPTNTSVFNKGTLAQSKNVTFTAPTGHQTIALGNNNVGGPNNYTLNGHIAEFIVYNAALNSLEREMVENYLGAKYNLAIATDRYTHQATHNIELIGIGNDGTNSQTSAQGKGVVEFNNASSLSSGDYLLAAHTDGNPIPSDTTDVDIPASIPNHTRFSRTWRVDETGDVGTVDVIFHLTGAEDFAASASYRLLVDTDGNFTDATVLTGSYSGGSVTFTGVDFADGDFFTLAGTSQQLDIESVTSGNWNETTTWDCGCIPTSSDNVTILAPDNVTVDADGNAANLTIESGATLTMNTASDLSLFGNFSIEGSMANTDGEITFAGTGPQSIDGDGQAVDLTFNDIEIDSDDEVTFTNLSANFILNGLLTPTDGEMTIDGSANFVIQSTTTDTEGRIGPIPGTFTGFGGDYISRRFIPGGNADWRELSAPVSGGTLASWDDDVEISGTGFPDGCAIDSVGDCFFSARYWQGNLEYNITDINDDLLAGEGYRLWLGDDLTTLTAKTMDITGSINDASDIPVSNTTGWNTVGNPYSCPVNFDDMQRTSQISDYFYIYDATLGGYQWYDADLNTSSIASLANGLVSIGQGFWINASSLGTLTFRQVDKNTTSTATYVLSPSDMLGSTFMLTLGENGTTYRGDVSFSENPKATDGIDTIDIKHLQTGMELGPIVAIDYGTEKFRKQHLEVNDRDRSFELYTEFQNEGYYTFDIVNLEGFRDYRKVLIFDKLENEYIDIKDEYSYTFYAEKGIAERFTLIFTNEEDAGQAGLANINELSDENISITQMGHSLDIRSDVAFDGPVQISVVNILGQTEVYTISTQLIEGSNLIHLPESLKGVHIFTLQDANQTISKKLVF